MKLVTYSRGDRDDRPGLLIRERIFDTAALGARLGWPEEMIATLTSNRQVIGLGPEKLGELAELADGGRLEGAGEVEPASVRLGPPVPDPQKIICLGLNYRDHAEETGIEPPSAPMFFAKFANSLIGPDDEIVPPKVAERVDYEAELAVVIGRSARNVGAEEALSYVAGAMAFNDVSARDLQLENPLWTGGKAIDTFAPCGPALVTLDAVGDLSDLAIRTWVNGDQVQDGSSSAMVFGIAETIAFLSRVMTLVPGDIIATGTPAGVGSSRTPPLFLHPGDLVEVEIDEIGRLSNRLADPI
jgi:2-keto-4-pentenoate hydratase/2-oxohepta-3-ene-1,7-dioic acid hydratase in catechol pathway